MFSTAPATLATYLMERKTESEKINKYLNLSRELKNMCHMKMTVISIIVSALGTVPGT